MHRIRTSKLRNVAWLTVMNFTIPLTPTRQGSGLELTLHCLGSFLVARNSARVNMGADRLLGVVACRLLGADDLFNRGAIISNPVALLPDWYLLRCGRVSLCCNPARMEESHDRPSPSCYVGPRDSPCSPQPLGSPKPCVTLVDGMTIGCPDEKSPWYGRVR